MHRNVFCRAVLITFTRMYFRISVNNVYWSLWLFQGTSLTMTLIPRAQTFQSFLSERTEEEQNQDQATAASSGCDRNCSTSPLRWHALSWLDESHDSRTFQSFRKLIDTWTVWTLSQYICMYMYDLIIIIIICRTVYTKNSRSLFLYVEEKRKQKTNAKKLYHKLYFPCVVQDKWTFCSYFSDIL